MKTRFTENKLASMSRRELYGLACELDIAGRASFSRQDLLKILQQILVEPPTSRSLFKISPPLAVAAKNSVAEKDIIAAEPDVQPEKPRRGRPPKVAEVVEAPVEKPRRGRPPKVAEVVEAPVEKPRRGRPPKAVEVVEAPVEKPRRGRPPKAVEVVEAPVEKPRRGRPPKAVEVVEAPVEKPRRGRPPKAAAVVEAPVEKPRRGRPPKAAAVVEAPVEKPRRGRPPKAAAVVEAPVEKPRRGRPPKAAAVVEAPVEKPRRGRPPKAVATVATPADVLPDLAEPRVAPTVEKFNKECEDEIAALKHLNRAFAKRSPDAPASANKKGATVVESSVAIPVNMPAGVDERKASGRAEQIEKERRRKHASLKTTMEIPVFSVPVYGSAPVGEHELTGELPEYYDEMRLVLQIRDPHWAHAYWELPPLERKRLELEVGIFEFAHSHFILKLHNVTLGHTQEIKLTENARNWYLYLEDARCVYQVELGLQSPTEGYTFVALSNLVQTPPDRVSEYWAAPVPPTPPPAAENETVPEKFSGQLAEVKPLAPATAHLTDPSWVYFKSTAGGVIPHPGSSELLAGHKLFPAEMPGSQPALPPGESSLNLPGSAHLQMPTSPSGLASMPGSANLPGSDTFSSLNLAGNAGGEVLLSLSADMLLYGRAPAGYHVFFMGQQIKVRPDGSFSLRLALPESASQKFELTAVDPKTGQQQIFRARFAFNKE